jgi:uncharacterized protein (TIGR02001 family)
MTRTLALAATALIGGSLLSPCAFISPAQAQTTIDSLGLTVTATPAISTDYLFRGISQTRNRPAAQLALDVQHDSGLYVGTFISNATFAGTNARMELDGLAGYRTALGGVNLDLGVVYYGYPGYDAPPGGFELAWWEAVLKGSYELEPVKFLGTIAYSPDFNLESGSAVYVEGGFDMKLDFDITVSARLGYQSVDKNNRFGLRDYTNFGFFASRELFAGITMAVGYYGTDLDKSDCAGAKICENRAMVSLSRVF